MIIQQEITLSPYPRGFHLITDKIRNAIPELPEKGIVNIFIRHTSAGLTLNENADPSVRTDFNSFFDNLVPENEPYYVHTLEGSDDMPAHLKSSIVGPSITIPVSNHRLNLGTWQGIYLCEFRNHGGSRKLVITIYS